MLKIGRDIEARSRWEKNAIAYADEIESPYHRHRIETVRSLLPDLNGKSVVDFGCGDGAFIDVARRLGATDIWGIDVSPSLIAKAQSRYFNVRYQIGGVEKLPLVSKCHCLIAANVLAYLTNEEEEVFYREAARLGGHLVVTHSNNLFDLFTFNAYTVDFCREHFGFDPSSLLAKPGFPNRVTFNIRENPLSYPDKLAKYGFRVEQMAFMNHHAQPPLLSGEDPDDMQRERLNTANIPEWKRYFQCSMFAVKAIKD